MNRNIVIAVLVGLLLGLWASAVTAQEASQGQLLRILTVKVDPSKISEYEAAVEDLFAELTKKEFAFPISASVGADLVYGFVTPMENFAALDKMQEELSQVLEANPQILERLSEASESRTYWMVQERPDLSYVPENPRLQPDEIGLIHLDRYYLRPGTEAEAEAISKEWVNLYRRKYVSDGFRVNVAVTGAELPIFTVATPAKDALDYQTQAQKIEELLGEEAQALMERSLSIIRRLEPLDITLRPDLSYQPTSAGQ